MWNYSKFGPVVQEMSFKESLLTTHTSPKGRLGSGELNKSCHVTM